VVGNFVTKYIQTSGLEFDIFGWIGRCL